MNFLKEDEYIRRVNIIYPSFYKREKYHSEEIIVKEFHNWSRTIYRKFEMIKWASYDLLCKYYEKIPESEKKLYNFDESFFQNKYIFIGQLECFYQYISFIDNHFSVIFSLNMKRDCFKMINIKNSICIKYQTFLNKMKLFSSSCNKFEKERITFICNHVLKTIKRIENRLEENDKLLFLSIFYKGSAQKINFYGIHPLIYGYIGTIKN
jgi:hypothetical protein